MKSCLILAVAIIGVAAISMIGCAGPAGFSYQNASITLTPFCENCPDGVIYNPAYPVPSPESGTFAIAIGAAGGTAGAAGAPALPNSVMLMPGSAGPGSTFWFQADVTNVPPNLTWAIYPTPDFGDITTLPSGTSATEGGTAGNNVYSYGSLVSASGNVAYFYEPSGPPTYTGGPALQQALAMGIPQGDVLLSVSAPADPSNPSVVVTGQLLIQIFNTSGNPGFQMFPRTPTNPSGLTTSVATVPRGTSFQFTGYAVGATPCLTTAACNAIYQNAPLDTTDNGVIWSVGNASGGPSSATVGGLVNGLPGPYGTITQTGLYTAPSVIPVSGYQPLIVLVPHAAPAVTPALAYITVN